MASEIQAACRLTVSKSGGAAGMECAGSFTLTGSKYQKGRQAVGTAEEALVLGDVTAGGWCAIKNHGPTNYVQVRAATGETPLVRLKVNEFCLFRLDAGATAPTVQANTAGVEIEVLLLVD